MKNYSIETWAAPDYDHSILERFEEMFIQIRRMYPNRKLHLLIETGDRYQALRSKLAKRAAKKCK